jgi:hypothetical protein
VTITGEPETLVGLHEFSARQTLTVKRGLAQTQPFVVPGQNSLPPGEYRVEVEGSGGDGAGLLATGSFFLGGVRDDEYARQLNAYHGVLREQAASELAELKQYTTTLEDQLRSTDQFFQTLWARAQQSPRAASSGTLERKWRNFSRQWTALQDQLNHEIQTSDGAPAGPGAFYAGLRALATSARDRVGEVHREQDAYFSSETGRDELEGKIADSASIAESAILSLKLKITSIEKAP